MQSFRLLALLFLVLGTSVAPLRAEPEAAPWREAITARYAAHPALEVAVSEISALAPIPGKDAGRTSLLAVADEGPYDAEHARIEGALFRIDLVHEANAPRIERVLPVTLFGKFDRFDPGWPANVSPFDLEGAARLPGREDLYLLSGERNPEDQTDDGANRLYLVRYPAGDDGRAELVRYYRVLDLLGDSMNDRFEGIAILPAAAGHGLRLYAFKERTPFPAVVPGYVHGTLEGDALDLAIVGDRGYPPLIPLRLTTLFSEVSSQSDALARPDGTIWVLDRWRREIHVARPDPEDGTLHLEGHWDLFDVVRDIPGEVGRGLAPPGLPTRTGFGRQEAITVDAAGRLYVAADRGGGTSSTLVVMEPKAQEGAPER